MYVGEMSDDLSTGVFLSNTNLNSESPNVGGRGLYLRRDLLNPGPGLLRAADRRGRPVEALSPVLHPERSQALPKDFNHIVCSLRSRTWTDDAPSQEPFGLSSGAVPTEALWSGNGRVLASASLA